MQGTAFWNWLWKKPILKGEYRMETPETLVEYERSPKVAAIHKLRINAKSLAMEAVLNRKEAKQAGKRYRDELYLHRVNIIRPEARHTYLALAFLRGRKYREVERNPKPHWCEPSAKRIFKKLEQYCLGVKIEQVREWLDAPLA